MGDFKNAEAVAKLAEDVDVVTVEIEHVDCDALGLLEQKVGDGGECVCVCGGGV